MSFSFNWAGTQINQIDPNESRQAYDDARVLGYGVAKAETANRLNAANEEYKGLLDRYMSDGSANPRIAELRARLSQLEARNAEIARMIQV